MESFNYVSAKLASTMAESTVRTDKRFQLTVLGAIAAVAIAYIAIVQLFLETSTIRWASILLLLLVLVLIAYLSIEL